MIVRIIFMLVFTLVWRQVTPGKLIAYRGYELGCAKAWPFFHNSAHALFGYLNDRTYKPKEEKIKL